MPYSTQCSRYLVALCSFVFFTENLATASVVKELWRTVDTLENPESAYVDPATGTLYVSNVAGQATEKDGKGWISKFTFDSGKPVGIKWVTGLNAPKGLRSHGGILYVADIDQLVAIDMGTGKITSRVTVPDAKFLNDVAVDKDGSVYVSEMLASRIYRFVGSKYSVFVEGGALLEGPNGLLIHGDKLYVASWGEITDPATFGAPVAGHLFSIDLKTKKRVNITQSPLGHLDGLERLSSGSFLVSDWVASKVYRIDPAGKVSEISLPVGKNAADIGWDPKKKRLYVPWMGESALSAVTF